MKRRRHRRFTAKRRKQASAILCVLLIFFAVYSEQAKEETIVFVHSNDSHGSVMAMDGWGGLAERAAIIDSIRREAGGNILLLDAGDWNTGQAVSNRFCARPDIEAYNYMGYDAVCLGNHEFDIPFDSLKMQMELMSFPVLTSNVFRNGKPVGMQYVKKTIGHKEIGIFGITTTATKRLSRYVDDITFEDEVEAARLLVQSLRGAGVSLVVAVVHMGSVDEGDDFTTSIELAKRVRGIDLIIDGHSHTYMPGPMVVNNTRVVSAYQNGHYIGVGKIVMKWKEMLEFDWKPVAVKDVKPDYELGRKLKRWTDRLRKDWGGVVGKLERAVPVFEGDRNLARWGESMAGDLVADAIVWKARDMGLTVDMGLINGGSIRAGLPEGWVTKADVLAMVPFENEVMVAEMYGSELIEVICELGRVMPGNGSFPQFSREVKMVVDTTEKHVLEFLLDGEVLDLDRVYKVATYDYIVEGRGRFKEVQKKKVKEYSAGFEVGDAVMDYIHDAEVIRPGLDGRFSFGKQEGPQNFVSKHVLPKKRGKITENVRRERAESKVRRACEDVVDGTKDTKGFL